MKYRFRLPDGTEIGGNTYAEVVQSMASFKLSDVRSIAGYRRETSRRAFELYQVKLDPSSDRSLIQSMVAAELLQAIK